MSSFYIRQQTEAWIGAITTIPFYQTINENQDPKDDIWLTVEYESYGATKETFCDGFVDDGDIILTFFGRVGLGYATLLQAAEAYSKLFYASTDLTGQLVLTGSNPPIDFVGDNNPWYVIEIAIDYEYRG